VIQILLVADDPGFRDRLRLALERLELTGEEEVSFLEAANGNDALVLAESQLPDLVVADVSVTPYGGFGLTRDLKANPETACPVILILDRFQDEWLGRWSGADALVNRPVDPFALAQVASQLIEEDEEEQGEATLEGAAP
jgi:CheY-like chemotaxis protein